MIKLIIGRLSNLSANQRERLLERSRLLRTADVWGSVKKIVDDVKENGDSAVRAYTKKFDGVDIQGFRVSDEEFEEARNRVDYPILEALEVAYNNIREFHEKQLQEDWFYERTGVKLGQIIRPLERVGCYVPGGRANYPSTVLMTVTPAKVAGVKEVLCVTPPTKDGKANESTLLACAIAGVREVYKVGGAQAIAALVYGTGSIPKVEKIVGPGNIYVTVAKRIVSGEVAIDIPAGPSEVLIIADDTAEAEFIAADMIAQAEHDPNASSILVATSQRVAQEVEEILERTKPQRVEARKSLDENGAIIIVDDIDEAISFSNEYAPEHLQIMTEDSESVLEKVKNAGSVFLGNFTPVACGDYASGTNHVLPTMGFAKVSSGLSVYDFIKFISVQKFDEESLERLSDTIITLAEAEKLYGHVASVRKRVKG
ncbi:MAG: histidinol dehydrogenase [Candidatus Hydrothermarchaeales archaeon]